jgi:NTP pyrophosphatase (non-canonical NTP hydrolase)
MYYLYHIPGKKIGVTCNLNNRVTITQGYAPDEYEVLDQSDDINYISEKEIELQKSYGYKVDRKKYNELIKSNNKMKINVTEQTTTFPIPVKKLKGHLMENLGMKWKTDHGLFVLNIDSIRWIEKNVKTSFYNDNRSFIYNKAFAEWFKAPELWGDDLPETTVVKCSKKPLKMFELIREWAQTRGLYDKGNSHTQYVKLQEEAGELAKALLNNDKPEIVDAIGDMVVVLTNLAHLQGVHIETCISEAYKVISKRTGKMINGTFVKDEN